MWCGVFVVPGDIALPVFSCTGTALITSFGAII